MWVGGCGRDLGMLTTITACVSCLTPGHASSEQWAEVRSCSIINTPLLVVQYVCNNNHRHKERRTYARRSTPEGHSRARRYSCRRCCKIDCRTPRPCGRFPGRVDGSECCKIGCRHAVDVECCGLIRYLINAPTGGIIVQMYLQHQLPLFRVVKALIGGTDWLVDD